MLLEPTALASAFRYLAESLEQDYGLDPAPLFARAGLALARTRESGARMSQPGTRQLWDLCVAATGDAGMGLKVGRRLRPEGLHALGYAWMSSGTLADALGRFARYVTLLVHLPVDARVATDTAGTTLSLRFPDPAHQPHPAGVEATVAGLVELAGRAAGRPVTPRGVTFSHAACGSAGDYRAMLGCPVTFAAPAISLLLDQADASRPLPTDNPEIAAAVDLVAARYIATLDTRPVATRVRDLLRGLLPAGESGQDLVAARLNRSPSTLRRQLQAEGLSYRTVLDETRRPLAEAYLQDERFSRAEIAYLVGFSDQSNLARAVRRWKSRPRQRTAGDQSQ